MENGCIDVERIADVLELPEGDGRRRHLEECPRCSALLLSYRAFLAAEDRPGADPGDARKRLEIFIESYIGDGSPAPTAAAAGPESPGFLSGLLHGLSRRPVWVMAAAVIVAAAALWWRPWVEERPVLRGTPAGAPAAPLELSAPASLAGGSLLLSWRPLEGADAYRVCLYDDDLTEIARFEAGPDTAFTIRPAMLPEGSPDGIFWRVVALAEGDEIAASQPSRLDF